MNAGSKPTSAAPTGRAKWNKPKERVINSGNYQPNQDDERVNRPTNPPPARSGADADSVEEEFLLTYKYSSTEIDGQLVKESQPAPESTGPGLKPGSIFRNRNFMLLWIAQAFTQTAQNTLNLALVSYVGRLTNDSPTYTAIASVCFLLPGVFFSAIAGVFVDRFRKRSILLVTNVSRAIIVPFLFFTNDIPLALALPIIFLITVVFSTISQFFNPAEGAAIPLLVSHKQLARANSLFQITIFATLFLGLAVLGPLLPELIGPKALFIALGVLYAICVVLVALLPNNEVIVREENEASAWENAKTLLREIVEAWAFIRSKRGIWLSIIYLSTVQTVLFTMVAIGIPFVGDKGLKQPPSAIVFVLAPLSIGLGISVALINRMVNPANRARIMTIACIALGGLVAAIGLVKPISDLWVNIFSPGVPLGGPGIIFLLVALSVPFGFAIGVLNVTALTVLQEESPKEILGRVFAAYFTFANAVSIIPILFAGALSDLIGIVPVFFLFGGSVILVGLYSTKRKVGTGE